MKFAVFFIMFFCACPQQYGGETLPKPAPAFSETAEFDASNINAAESAGIRDRLMTDLFFRGRLADKIMEGGFQNRIPDFTPLEISPAIGGAVAVPKGQGGFLTGFTARETYSETRQELIRWIERNPGKAAEIYLYLGGATGGKIPDSAYFAEPAVTYKILVNPYFLAILDALEKAAADRSMPDETVKITADRLFAGRYENVHVMDFGRFEQKINENFFAEDFADFRLNAAGLDKEVKNVSGAMSAIQAAIGEIFLSRGKGNGGKIKELFEETFSIYQTFLIEAASLKGRKVITGKESKSIENKREALRRNIVLLYLMFASEDLNIKSGLFAGKNSRNNEPLAEQPHCGGTTSLWLIKCRALCHPTHRCRRLCRRPHQALGAMPPSRENGKLAYESGLLAKTAAELIAKTQSGAPLGEIYPAIKSFESTTGAWLKKLFVFMRLSDMLEEIKALGFSCAYDRFLYSYLNLVNPDSNYVVKRKKMRKTGRVIEKTLENLYPVSLHANRVGVGVYNETDLKWLADAIPEINKTIEEVKKFSILNKKTQFILWDAFFMPVDIGYAL
ncbi:MAG: hypothetical protein HY746_02860 [Elusimicrobia bacterium]|nr:hypothetical protein [Elusimicrobiota bacterium]